MASTPTFEALETRTLLSISSIVSNGAFFAAVAGQQVDPVLATFTTNDTGPLTDFSAAVNWGDGTASVLVQVNPSTGVPTQHTIQGSHIYYHPGVYGVEVNVVDLADDSGNSLAIAGNVFGLLTAGGVIPSQPASNETFVAQVYLDLLKRPADTAGLNAWTNALNNGSVNRTVLAYTFETTTEYHTLEVDYIYAQYLHRQVDPAGLAAGLAFLATGTAYSGTEQRLAASVIGSPEYFQNRGGGNFNGFINAVYEDVLFRPVDVGGLAQWAGEFSTGTPLSTIALSVLQSDESYAILVSSYYVSFYNREPDSVGIGTFIGQLDAGAPSESVIALFLGEAEYLAKS